MRSLIDVPIGENRIVWVRNPIGLRYLRENLITRDGRTGRPRRWRDPWTAIYAWSELAYDAPRHPGGWRRRVWTIDTRWDPYNAGAPCEGVHVDSIRAGQESELVGALRVSA